MDRERVDPRKLTVAEVRHVANELWTALKLREWVTYSRALRDGGKFRTFGGGRFPRMEPSSVVEGRGIAGMVYAEPELGIMRGLAFYLSGGAWDAYVDELVEPVSQALAHELSAKGRPRALFVKQTTPHGRAYRRNAGGGVSVELASGIAGAVARCELWRLSAEDEDRLADSRPVPSAAVIESLQSVLAA